MSLTPQQRRTHKARETFLSQFEDDESRRSHMGELAERSAQQRRGGIVLSAEEKDALAAAYELLGRIHQRHADKFETGAADGS